jgi:hypothetical protein
MTSVPLRTVASRRPGPLPGWWPGSLLVARLLKLTVLARPYLDAAGAVAHHNSFPSGHVSAAVPSGPDGRSASAAAAEVRHRASRVGAPSRSPSTPIWQLRPSGV